LIVDSLEIFQLVMQPCQLSILVQTVSTPRWTMARRMCWRGWGELEHEKMGEVCRAFAACSHLLFEAPSSCHTIDPRFPDHAAVYQIFGEVQAQASLKFHTRFSVEFHASHFPSNIEVDALRV
jgi:hypothetical protein